MLKTIQKATKLLTNPNMAFAYSRWLFNRVILGKSPEVNLTVDTSVGEWLSFSEYWSFSKGIPAAEKSLINLQFSKGDTSIHSSRVAIDIGANVGLFTIYLATVGYDRVYGFEPVPQTFERLKINVSKNVFTNSSLVLNCLAVGAKKGIVEFEIFDDSPAQNRLLNLKEKAQKSAKSLQIPVVTLDDYCADNAIESIDFLKVDVEGMEPLVIKGANRMLNSKQIKMILIEICPDNLRLTGNNSLDELYNLIVGVGYTPYELLANGSLGSELSLNAIKNIILANVVLIPTIK